MSSLHVNKFIDSFYLFKLASSISFAWCVSSYSTGKLTFLMEYVEEDITLVAERPCVVGVSSKLLVL